MKRYLTLCLVIISWNAAHAQWTDTTYTNTPVCTFPSAKSMLRIASDSSGGAFVSWVDTRGTKRIYSQRISAFGQMMWTVDGVQTCDTGAFAYLSLMNDDADGLHVIWGDNNVFWMTVTRIQRLNGQGVRLWGGNGKLQGGSYQAGPLSNCQDGKGGIISAWLDAGVSASFKVQCLDSAADTNWVTFLEYTDPGAGAQVVPRSDGGTIVFYHRSIIAQAYDRLHAQRVGANGGVLWGAQGVPVSRAFIQNRAHSFIGTISTDAGGAICAWDEELGSINNRTYNYYIQKVDSLGIVPWGTTGILLFNDSSGYSLKQIATDGSGGVLLLIAQDSTGLLAQKYSATGVAQWPQPGVPIASGLIDRGEPVMVSDGLGGAVICWSDRRIGNADIFAQRISQSGQVMWQANGKTISDAPGDQNEPQITTDMKNGAIIAWLDKRAVTSTAVYTVRINSNGIVLPVELTDFTARIADESVRLDWVTATEYNNRGFSIERSTGMDGEWKAVGFVPGRGGTVKGQRYSFLDPLTPGMKLLPSLYYRLRQQDFDGTEHLSGNVQVLMTLPDAPQLYEPYPNPARESAVITYAIKGSQHVRLSVYDVFGRLVELLADEAKEAGIYSAKVNGKYLPCGSYLVHLQVGSKGFTRNMTIFR